MERKVMKALQQLYLLQQDSLIRIVLPAKQDVKEIAIKWKLPTNNKQMADKIVTLARGANTPIERIALPYFPIIFTIPRKQVA